MKQKDEKWALFWCDLLHLVLFDEVEPEQIQDFLKELAGKETVFPGGRTGKPSLSTLKRKLKRYRNGGFDAVARKDRSDRGYARATPTEIIVRRRGSLWLMGSMISRISYRYAPLPVRLPVLR